MVRADRVPFLSGYGLVTVYASLNGSARVALLVDTGAEQMVISRGIP